MKVFISADIEGITTTTQHEECGPASPAYAAQCQQMTKEVLAACEGAFAGGATEIWIKDAHGPGTNIDPYQIPENVILQRKWSGHPYSMVQGVNSTFDCAFFVGYHSAASKPGNPMSHTFTGRPAYIKINGRLASEFQIYSWACALEGVPTVFLAGDKMLCEDELELHPGLVTCPVKDGIGSQTINYSPVTTLKAIREKAEQAVKQDLSKAKIELPKHFDVEIFFKDQTHADTVGYFPGCARTGNNTVEFHTDSYYEVLRTLKWIL